MDDVRQGQSPKALQRRLPDVTAAFSNTAEDPAERFARLRTTCPVALQSGLGSNGGGRSAWLVTRYEDILACTRDPDTFGQSIRFVGKRRPPLESNPPEHRAWRSMLQPFFLPKSMARLEPVAKALAAELIEPLVKNGGGDFATEVARPLPAQVLLTWMNQPREDWLRIKECCEAAYLQSSEDPEDLENYAAADAYLWDYSRSAVEDRKRAPRDPSTDPIQAMISGTVEGVPLEEDLIVGAIRLILAAGHDSTTSAVGICIQYLAEHADVQERLRNEPRRIAAAIEEILRLRPPVIQMPRTVRRSTQLRGVAMETDDAALLVFASGNLDEEAFPDATQFKIDRMPNRHLSFGVGIHTCIGNVLARQEIRVVIEQLLHRTVSFSIDAAPDHEFWHPYGATSLPLRFEAAVDG